MKTKTKAPIIIMGKEYTERLADTQTRSDLEEGYESRDYAFGFKNLTINGKPLSKDDNKFIVYAESFEVARAEFWSRWQIFIKKAFGRKFVPILKA